MAIILDHVNYIYEAGTAMEHAALKDVNLVIPDGQFIGLIGHTGSGKSTLVQLLNGLLAPTSGSVYYNGADIHDSDYNKKELRRKVGLVFQYPEHQLFEIDVFPTYASGLKILGLIKRKWSCGLMRRLSRWGWRTSIFISRPLTCPAARNAGLPLQAFLP